MLPGSRRGAPSQVPFRLASKQRPLKVDVSPELPELRVAQALTRRGVVLAMATAKVRSYATSLLAHVRRFRAFFGPTARECLMPRALSPPALTRQSSLTAYAAQLLMYRVKGESALADVEQLQFSDKQAP